MYCPEPMLNLLNSFDKKDDPVLWMIDIYLPTDWHELFVIKRPPSLKDTCTL